MEAALEFLAGSPISLSSIFVTLFKQPTYNHHICLHDIHNNLHTILNTLVHNPSTREEVLSWTKCVTAEIYCKELTALTDDETLHFNARRATASRLEEFSIGKLAQKMETHSPFLWSLLDSLLEANRHLLQRRENYAARESQRNRQT
jgi:hypothetical protein